MGQQFKIIDLFSGAGGLTLGFEDERFCGGFESVLAIDNNQYAIDTFNDNFGKHGLCTDIEKWLATKPEIPTADVVVGGPPCQGFSLLNKKREGDVRRSLWEPFMDVVELSAAPVFVIENVQGLFKSHEFKLLKERAERLGFQVEADVLNSADYGTPQTRKRTIIVAWKCEVNNGIVFPPPSIYSAPGSNDNLPDWLTVKSAIGDLPEPEGTMIRDVNPPLDLHFGRNPTPTSIERYKAVPPGGNRFDLQKNALHITPNCWIKKKTGGTDLFGRLWWDRPSVTIRTEFFKPEKGRYLHPVKHRPITHREAARLMGFPDNFVFSGSKVEIAKQIGNAVPPALAGAIAKQVKEGLLRKQLIKAV